MAQRRRRLRSLLTPALLLPILALSACDASAPGPSDEGSATAAPPGLEDVAPGLLPAADRFAQPALDGPATAAVTISVGEPGEDAPSLSSTNVGLSFEATDLADERLAPDGSSLATLVGALDRPSLRFGGNAVDRRMWWTSSDEPAPEWAEATVTPEDMDRLAAFAEETDATVTLALDLGHNDPERAADMAFHAHEALGDRLAAVSIGNEPNGYHGVEREELWLRDSSWDENAYIEQARRHAEAIHARVPGLGIVGPGAFDAPWWRAFGDAGIPNTVALSQHWYPMWDCDGDQEPRAQPTVENASSPWLHERAEFMIGMGADTAESYGLPLWFEETGPTSCPGTQDSSRTHAVALWTVDYVLHGASLGVQRMNMHSMLGPCAGGAPMSAVCTHGRNDPSHEFIVGQGNYLALLFVAQLREGPITPLEVSSDPNVFGYAVTDDTGTDVVVVNLHDPATDGAAPVTLEVPGDWSAVEAAQLRGKDLAERNGSQYLQASPIDDADVAGLEVNAGTAALLRFDR